MLAAIILIAGLGLWWADIPGDVPDTPDMPTTPTTPLALVTSLPIYWNEGAEIGDMLASSDGDVHWARRMLERTYQLQPIDTLDQLKGAGQRPQKRHLLMIQPRPLGAQDNIALDQWVRAGGQLLLFADPMLTGHSGFSLGDPRRPQDVALLSPILSRWGVALYFDDSQLAGMVPIEWEGATLPVNLPGTLALEPSLSDSPGKCQLLLSGLAAQCIVGEGRVTIIADAALFEQSDDQSDEQSDDIAENMRRQALAKLLSLAFTPAP